MTETQRDLQPAGYLLLLLVWTAVTAAAQVFVPPDPAKLVTFVLILGGVGVLVLFVALTEAGWAAKLAGFVVAGLLLATLPSAISHQVLGAAGRVGECAVVRVSQAAVSTGEGTSYVHQTEVKCGGKAMTVPRKELKGARVRLHYHPSALVPPLTEQDFDALEGERRVAGGALLVGLFLVVFLAVRHGAPGLFRHRVFKRFNRDL